MIYEALHGAPEPVLLARVQRQHFQRIEVQLHLGDRAIGEDDAAVAGPRLDGNLGDAGVVAQRLERSVVALHERLQLVHVAVFAADFADLRADRHGDVVRLASGLNLYYTVQNVLSLPQQYFVGRRRLKQAGKT